MHILQLQIFAFQTKQDFFGTRVIVFYLALKHWI